MTTPTPPIEPAADGAPTHLAHRRADLVGDYARGGGGALLTGAPLVAFEPHWLVAVLLVGSFGLFGAFVGKTWLKQRTRIVLDGRGVAAEGPFGRRLDWDRLDRLALKFYSTKRDRSQGWMTLTLGAGGRKLAVESSLEGFETLVAAAAAAAYRNGVPLSDGTVGNLAALGILPDAPR